MSAPALPTVLIVDDDRVNRTVLAELLKADCRVLLAKDGPSALRRIADQTDISLILLDITMPGMDGYEVLRRLRAERNAIDTAVIFVTAMAEEQEEERGLLLGAVDYVTKPIRPAIVHARIRNHLKLVAQHRQLEMLAEQDGLTGISNRRHFDRAFDQAFRSAARNGEPIGVAMIDVDHFKQYNDRYGHGAGDEVLRQVARVISDFANRPYDVAARYGGEEFVLLLPGTVDLNALLEQLRQQVVDLKIAHEASQTAGFVTVSCGGIVLEKMEGLEPHDFLEQADQLLYEAKQQGRNRVMVREMVL